MTTTDLISMGIDPCYWYPAIRLKDLGRRPTRVRLWHQDVVLFRSRQGDIVAFEDRCRHRKVALSEGMVDDTGIVCPFHGWCYDTNGVLARIPYWPDARPLPKLSLRRFPTTIGNGIVWIRQDDSTAQQDDPGFYARLQFPGDQWFHIIMDRTFPNHFAFGVINGMDFFHFHLHRRYQPWQQIRLVARHDDADSVTADYEITMEGSLPARLFKRLLRNGRQTRLVEQIHVEYVYPHHFASVGEDMKVTVFFRPIDERQTHVFIDMYFARPQKFWVPRWLYLNIVQKLFFYRIQAEDAWAGELEQRANETAPDVLRAEINPISLAVEHLIETKWRRFDGTMADADPGHIAKLPVSTD